MNIRTFILSCGLPLATLLILPGCASTQKTALDQPAISVTGGQLDAEMSMIKEQSEQIIAEVQKQNSKSSDRIILNDELTIEVWMRDQKTQFTGFPLHRHIPDSGKIFIPYIGLTMVNGKTDQELKTLLSEHFNKILQNATVVVEHSRKLMLRGGGQAVKGRYYISVLGWAAKPGLYELEPGITTLRDLISTAGGTRRHADTKRIYVIRGSLDNPEVIRINFAKVCVGKNISQNIILCHNDAIYIPPIRMQKVYNVIRIVFLPISALRDAVGFIIPAGL